MVVSAAAVTAAVDAVAADVVATAIVDPVTNGRAVAAVMQVMGVVVVIVRQMKARSRRQLITGKRRAIVARQVGQVTRVARQWDLGVHAGLATNRGHMAAAGAGIVTAATVGRRLGVVAAAAGRSRLLSRGEGSGVADRLLSRAVRHGDESR